MKYQLLNLESTKVSRTKKKPAVTPLVDLEQRAGEASTLLSNMANAKRLMVLCNLLDGEKSVGELAEIVGLSASALSQHLGKMRAYELVQTRRDGQTIYYALASDKVRAILETLYKLYCAPEV